MIKKLQRLAKALTVVALPLVLVFTLINVLLLAQYKSTDTTLILQQKEIFKKGSDTSSSELNNSKDKFKQRLALDGLGKNLFQPRDTVDRKSGDGEKISNKAEEHTRIEIDQRRDRVVMQDKDIDRMIEKLNNPTTQLPFFPKFFWNSTLSQLTRSLGSAARKFAKTLAGYKTIKITSKDEPLPAWKRVHRNIRQFSLYDPDDPNVAQLIEDMKTLPIVESDDNEGGTQLKINIRFSDGGRAVMKPMRYGREVEADENRYIFDDMERHISEIAAFQLDKTLGFYKVPPTVGRKINITSELRPIVPESVFKTFFTSPAGNLCFFGKCDYYCDSAFAFCGHPDMIEVSLMSYLPSRNVASRKSWYQPWRRSYSKWRKAYWELNTDLCDTVRDKEPFNNTKILLDMIDTHTFDFLTGNKDRHSFATFREWGNHSFTILYDNGRGFGRQTYDAMSILAPLNQCCMIRKSTLLKYIKLYTGPERLSDLMEEALRPDPIAPILIKGHLNALDRRLLKILKAVTKCLETNTVAEVVINDRF